MSQWVLEEIASGRHGAPVYGLWEGGLRLATRDRCHRRCGGAHWPMYVPLEREAVIRDYHGQNMFLATRPLVSIVAHPWWWMGA